MKNIIVTGATGMTGAFLAEVAAGRGDSVTAVVRPNSAKIRNVPQGKSITIVECELSELANCPALDGEDGFFYHFAWEAVEGRGRDDAEAQSRNIQYTIDAAALAKRSGCACFVGAGSQAEYGRVESGIFAPDTPVNPQTGYGIAKYAAGKLSRLYCKENHMRHCWVRLLCAYGPKDNAFRFTMYLINTLLKKENPVLTDCRQIWDYIYAEDAAKAFLAIGEKGKDGAVYCLGSGEAAPLKSYAETIKNAIDPSVALEYGKRGYNFDQVLKMQADITNLTKDTGFVPQTSFEEGIARTIEWVKTQNQQ